MIKIDTQPIVYFSALDEEHFFNWAQEIECVQSIERGYLHIDESAADDTCIRELVALFHRYGLRANDLAALCTSSNEGWFKNSNAYWYEGVFGRA